MTQFPRLLGERGTRKTERRKVNYKEEKKQGLIRAGRPFLPGGRRRLGKERRAFRSSFWGRNGGRKKGSPYTGKIAFAGLREWCN